MSKTDAHRPPWVQLMDDAGFPVHRHQNGVCDLPSDSEDKKAFWQHWQSGNCYWQYKNWRAFCGCSLCTDQFERKAKRKRERRSVRQECRVTCRWTGGVDDE